MKNLMQCIRTGALLVVLAGCGGKSAKNSIVVTGNGGWNHGAGSEDSSTQSAISNDVLNTRFQIDTFSVPSVTLFDSRALEAIYKPVFGDSPRSESTKEPFKTRPTEFFSTLERERLGEYYVTGFRPGSTNAQNTAVMKRTTALDSEYIAALRSFLGDACTKLVKAELLTPSKAENKLVQGDKPPLAKLDGFMTLLLGFQAESGSHSGVNLVADAFDVAMNAEPKPKNASETAARVRATYIHACIVLASSPQVYSR